MGLLELRLIGLIWVISEGVIEGVDVWKRERELKESSNQRYKLIMIEQYIYIYWFLFIKVQFLSYQIKLSQLHFSINPDYFSGLKLRLAPSIIQFMDVSRSSLLPFVVGGLSGSLATMVIQPLDTLKVQIQIVSQSLGKVRSKSKSIALSTVFMKIKNQQGLQVLYRGLDSAILRQLAYASVRLGTYDLILSTLAKKQINYFQKVAISILSGAFGALIGNPFDVALIRRQASITNGKTAYKNTFYAFSRIVKQQGLSSLWTGINITILRVSLINVGQLAGRDYISQVLQPFNLKQQHNNIVALSASLLTAAISLPADNIKVKLQKQEKSQKIYKGIWDCLAKSVQREGLMRLWVGFPIYLIRGAPHSFILIRAQMFLNEQWSCSKSK